MAKGNGAAVQYKVHLKPTEVGQHVIKRLERPHMDKSGELRKLIELGYAAEQAGFILDGTVLRHAGRAWEIQPSLTLETPVIASSRQGSELERRSATVDQGSQPGQQSTSLSEAAASPGDISPGDASGKELSNDDTLLGRLRGLSS